MIVILLVIIIGILVGSQFWQATDADYFSSSGWSTLITTMQQQQQQQQRYSWMDDDDDDDTVVQVAVTTAAQRVQEACDMIHPGWTCPSSSSTSSRRRVIVLHSDGRFPTWRQYYSMDDDDNHDNRNDNHKRNNHRKPYLGGEGYWSASLTLLLESMGFRVVTWHGPTDGPYGNWQRYNHHHHHHPDHPERQWRQYSLTSFPSTPQSSSSPILSESDVHRIVADCGTHYTRRALYDPHVLCKRRGLNWWGRGGEGDACTLLPVPPDHHDRLSTSRHVWTPFLAHSQVLPRRQSESSGKERQTNVFLLSKRCSFPPAILEQLLGMGLHLHATCFLNGNNHNNTTTNDNNDNHSNGNTTGSFTNHGKLTPFQFQRLLQRMNLVIGFGKPLLSPTPFEALAQGCAFLNPLLPGRKHTRTQNDALLGVGEPYVYEYDNRSPQEQQQEQQQETDGSNGSAKNVVSIVPGLLQQVERALQQSVQRQRRGGFVPPYASTCELRKLLCQNLILDNSTCEAANRTMTEDAGGSNSDNGHPEESQMPSKLCLNTCGKRPGLREARYQDDLAIIQKLHRQGNLSRLMELASIVEPYPEDQ